MAGDVVKCEIEKASREENVDHIYVTVDAGLRTPVTLSINTLSFRSRIAGYDPRIRIGTLETHWLRLPTHGLYPLEFFDYDTVDLVGHVAYRIRDRVEMEDFFALRCGNCRRIEAWGSPYSRTSPGLHQIHSRRASAAVPGDMRGHDGAVRFYFDEGQRTELVLLKFCGQ